MKHSVIEELRSVLVKRAEHVAAIRKIDSYLSELRMVMDTRTSTGHGFGRPDVSSERVIGTLSQAQAPMTTTELREATGLKKTTLEVVVRRLVAGGQVVRDPAEWRGPNGNYRYSLNSDVTLTDRQA